MCVRAIIDASAFRHLVEPASQTAGAQFRNWVLKGNGLIVHAQEVQYEKELANNPKVIQLLEDYRRRGLVELIETARVQRHRDHVPGRPTRRSNDLHILALAAASQATVLFSCDSDLQNDFASADLLGKVGRKRRRSLPLQAQEPGNTTGKVKRKRFLDKRKCDSRR